jgi:hypothetical protein
MKVRPPEGLKSNLATQTIAAFQFSWKSFSLSQIEDTKRPYWNSFSYKVFADKKKLRKQLMENSKWIHC